MFWSDLIDIRIPLTVALASIAAVGYLVARFRIGDREFGLLDCLQIVFLMAIVSGGTLPLLEGASEGAKQSALLQNLYAIRSQIALYKAQHGGDPPVLFRGTFPQLIQATDALGRPGPAGIQHPYGPYFPDGIPPNPLTGEAAVTRADTFPPHAASGNGGWLFHEETGQIAADVPDMLDR